MFDSEKLIREMKKQPCLWMPHKEDGDEFSKRDLRQRLTSWECVARSFYPEASKDEDLSAEIVALKKKWNNIRDSYRKYKQSSSKKKKYIYAEFLTFLDPCFEEKSNEINNTTQYENKYNENVVLPPTDEPLDNTFTKRAQKRFKSNKPKHFKRKLLEILKQTSTQPVNEEDPDKSFVLSLLSDFRSLSDAQKLQYKIGALELMQNIKFPRTSQNPFPPGSSYQGYFPNYQVQSSHFPSSSDNTI